MPDSLVGMYIVSFIGISVALGIAYFMKSLSHASAIRPKQKSNLAFARLDPTKDALSSMLFVATASLGFSLIWFIGVGSGIVTPTRSITLTILWFAFCGGMAVVLGLLVIAIIQRAPGAPD